MGSATRMKRASRFIEEFGLDYEKAFGTPAPGTVLKVVGHKLGGGDSDGEVKLWATLEDEGGVRFTFSHEGIVFDAGEEGIKLVAKVQTELGIDDGKERVKRANLF